MESILIKNQVKEFGPKFYTEQGENLRMIVKIRYDDQCGNGHNTFSITADIDQKAGNRYVESSGGCCHDDIAKHFPELKHLIKWHLCSSDGPLHYVANTLYHAGDTDCHGLRKGEKRQLRNGKTGKLCWILEEHPQYEKYVYSDTKPELPDIKLKYIPWERIGEGKEPQLEYARSSAIWPDATLEQLRDRKALESRLPALLAEFKKDVESLGFIY